MLQLKDRSCSYSSQLSPGICVWIVFAEQELDLSMTLGSLLPDRHEIERPAGGGSSLCWPNAERLREPETDAACWSSDV